MSSWNKGDFVEFDGLLAVVVGLEEDRMFQKVTLPCGLANLR